MQSDAIDPCVSTSATRTLVRSSAPTGSRPFGRIVQRRRVSTTHGRRLRSVLTHLLRWNMPGPRSHGARRGHRYAKVCRHLARLRAPRPSRVRSGRRPSCPRATDGGKIGASVGSLPHCFPLLNAGVGRALHGFVVEDDGGLDSCR